jgi:hypothetical protein
VKKPTQGTQEFAVGRFFERGEDNVRMAGARGLLLRETARNPGAHLRFLCRLIVQFNE